MDFYLRKVDNGQMLVPEGYRVILKDGGEEIELGSIGIKHGAGAAYYWAWGIDHHPDAKL